MSNQIIFENATFKWSKEKYPLLENFSLKINCKQTTAILGSSGCGKTTLLRLIAGLIPLTSGKLSLRGDLISTPSPKRVLVFQKYSLFDWMTIKNNIIAAMNFSEKTERSEERVSELLEMVKLQGVANKYPHELSGGMQQRAALARALSVNPEIILMDEPFSSLDLQTRQDMQVEVSAVIKTNDSGAVLVTHHAEEAVFFADRIIIIGKSPIKVLQDIQIQFERPRDRFLRKNEEYLSVVDNILNTMRAI